MNRIIQTMLSVVAGILLMTCLNGCKQDHLTLNTSGVVNAYSYLKQNDQFSLFKQIVDKAGYASFLDTYGTYTVFAPNNDGVNAYLKSTGKAGIANIDAATAKSLVSMSIIADTIGTQYFTDGKIRTPSTSGQYIITGAKNVNGVTKTLINRQAFLVQGNIKVGNGLIHVIDNMLVPAALNLAQTIEQNPKFSIFTAALKATGLYDSLTIDPAVNGVVSRRYQTVIAESDSVLAAANIPSFDALKAKYSKTGNPLRNPADSLWLFVAYHIWPELSYQSDIAISTSHTTLAPLEITTSELDGDTIKLNNDTFNGVLEPGQLLDRVNGDVSATNGVVQSVLGHYAIKVRSPSPVYYDVADQPEIRRTPGLYRVPGASHPFTGTQLSNIQGVGSSKFFEWDYKVIGAVPAASDWWYNGDWLQFGVRFRLANGGSTALPGSIITTPVIVKGRYKIWVDYQRGVAYRINVSFDGQPLPNTLNNGDGLNEAESEGQAEVRGFKSYSGSPATGTTNTSQGYNGYVGRLLGVVDIPTTDHHKLDFESQQGSGGTGLWLMDAIEFRPVDMDQLYPKLGRNGELIPRP